MDPINRLRERHGVPTTAEALRAEQPWRTEGGPTYPPGGAAHEELQPERKMSPNEIRVDELVRLRRAVMGTGRGLTYSQAINDRLYELEGAIHSRDAEQTDFVSSKDTEPQPPEATGIDEQAWIEQLAAIDRGIELLRVRGELVPELSASLAQKLIKRLLAKL